MTQSRMRGIGADGAARTDGGIALQNGAGEEHGVLCDGNAGVDVDCLGVQDADAAGNVAADNAVPEHQLQFGNAGLVKNGNPAGDQLRGGDVVGHFLLPGLLELVAGCGVGKAGAGLLHGQGGAGQHQNGIGGGQELLQISIQLGYGDVGLLREAGSGLFRKAGTADDKKPLHAVGHQLSAGPLQHGAEQDGFQHQRLTALGKRGIFLKEKHDALGVIHGVLLLFTD